MLEGRESGKALGVIADHGNVGYGHLARSLALMQHWVAAGGGVRFHSSAPLPDGWARRLEEAGARILSMDDFDSHRTDAWVLDGYRFDPQLQSRLRATGVLAVVDDYGTVGRYDADLIIDQNLGASSNDYSCSNQDVELLLGPGFALLRSEIVEARPAQPPDRSREPRRLLVALGGQPSDAVRDLVAPTLNDARRWGLEVDRLEGVADVSQPLVAADLALSAAGSTCWELCSLGVPAVILAVAPNQRPIARRLGEAGAAIDAGDLESTSPSALSYALRSLVDDPDRRAAQCLIGRNLVDGMGAERVVAAIRAHLETR